MFNLAKLAVPLRLTQLLFAFLVMALMSAVASFFNLGGAASFLLFCGVWGILASLVCLGFIFKTPANMSPKVSTSIVAAIDVLTAIFFFAGFIAAATVAGGCGGPDTKFRSHCRAFSAADAFGAFSWVLWTVSSIMTVPLAIRAFQTNRAANTTPVAAPVATPTQVEAAIPPSSFSQPATVQSYPMSSAPQPTYIPPYAAPAAASASPAAVPVAVPSSPAVSIPPSVTPAAASASPAVVPAAYAVPAVPASPAVPTESVHEITPNSSTVIRTPQMEKPVEPVIPASPAPATAAM